MTITTRHCARCGQVAVLSEVTEDGETFRVYTCPAHKEVVWKEHLVKEPETVPEPGTQVAGQAAAPRKREPKAINGPDAQLKASEPASSPVEPAAAPKKREPKTLN